MKTAAVIGASGFLGSQISKRLKNDGWNVVCAGRGNYEDVDNAFVTLDIFDEPGIDNFLLTYKPTLLISTAWETKPGEFWNKESNRIYASATTRLADRGYQLGVNHFIGFGTMTEYGYSPGACNAKITKLAPQDLYSETKSDTGISLKVIADSHGKNFNWMRVFQAFGQNEKENRFIPTLIMNLKAGKEFKVLSPNNILDWIHTEEIASVLSFCLSHNVLNYIDVGTGIPTSVSKISELICEELQLDTSLLDTTSQVNSTEKKIFVSQSSEIFNLGWKPQLSLRDRLRSLNCDK